MKLDNLKHSIKLKAAVYIIVPLMVFGILLMVLDYRKNSLTKNTLNHYMDYLKEMIFMSTYDSLKKGNMTLFSEVLAEIGEYDLVKEFSLITPEGNVKYSSDPANVDTTVDLSGVAQDKETVIERNGITTFYYPVVTAQYCLRCHRDWAEGGVNSFYKASLDSSAKTAITRASAINNILLILAGLAVMVLVVIVIQKLVFSRLERANEVLDNLCTGEGDLTIQLSVRGPDEIGILRTKINNFIAHLRGMIADLKEHIADVDGEIGQIQSDLNTINESVQENVSNIMTISSSSEQVSCTLNENITNLTNLTESVNSKKKTISQSLSNVMAITGMINEMTGSVDNLSKTVTDLEQRSNDINNITNLITEIADQTNLLALNAAIEAARAGEAGRGFAVVADEIRKLAERTTSATNDIKSIVTDNTRIISGIVSEISNNKEHAESMNQGISDITQFTREVDRTMEDITGSITNLSHMLTESISALELTLGSIETVNSNMGHTGEVSGRISETSKNLRDKSSNMKHIADKFKTS
ncbi:MAG: methyl-accepting chemotaxis protein [Deferribacterales bacterium]